MSVIWSSNIITPWNELVTILKEAGLLKRTDKKYVQIIKLTNKYTCLTLTYALWLDFLITKVHLEITNDNY